MSTLLERLTAKIGPPDRRGCRLWKGAVSQSGWRGVFYGAIRGSLAPYRMWRVNRLVLLLKTAPIDCPRDPGESFEEWLHRADRAVRHMEASHACDVALCAAGDHLEWKDHVRNVKDGAARRRDPSLRPKTSRRDSAHDAIIDAAVRELRRARLEAPPAWEDDE